MDSSLLGESDEAESDSGISSNILNSCSKRFWTNSLMAELEISLTASLFVLARFYNGEVSSAKESSLYLLKTARSSALSLIQKLILWAAMLDKKPGGLLLNPPGAWPN